MFIDIYDPAVVFLFERKKMSEVIKNTQSEKELEQMADFYAKHYSQVYFVRCLKTNLVVAVECSPAKAIQGFTAIKAPRRDGERDIYDYQGLFLTTRERLDKTPDGFPMIGYEALTGNDTRLSKFERGVIKPIELENAKPEVLVNSFNLSPFERAQMESEVAINQASANEQADYELKYNNTGMVIERFETFQIERVR